MDFESIKKRNIAHIKACVETYDFEKTVDEILDLANVFVQSDVIKKTVRLFGEIRDEEVTEDVKNGKVTAKTKVKYQKVTLYSFSQRSQKGLTEDEVIQIFKDISLIAAFHTQLKYISKIDAIENGSVKTLMTIEEFYKNIPTIQL